MIDWSSILANFLWIFALALALATLSYARWQAAWRSEKLKRIVNLNAYQAVFNLAGALFCAGLAMTAQPMIMKLIWSLFGLGFTWLSLGPLRGLRTGKN